MADRIKVVIEGESQDLVRAAKLAEHAMGDLTRTVATQDARARTYAAGQVQVVRSVDRVTRAVDRQDNTFRRLGRTMETVGWGSLALGAGPAVASRCAAGCVAARWQSSHSPR